MTKLTVPLQPTNGLVLLDWARETAIADRRTYRRKSRPFTLTRALRLIRPNLQRPCFIVGAPRSGTTFLGACLGELPELSYHFEPVATKAAAKHVYHRDWNAQTASWFYKSVYAWLMRLHGDGDLRFAEKTPRNCFILPFLAKTFPDAQFIHIIRDGRDAALSYSKKPWLQAAAAAAGKWEPGGYPYGPYARFWVERDRIREFETTSDIHRCIWAWKRFTTSGLAAAADLKNRYYELRYEHLVAAPAEAADRLLDFLEISAPTSRMWLKRAIAQASQDSVGQWRRELTPEQLQQIQAEAGDLLRQLGYLSEEGSPHE